MVEHYVPSKYSGVRTWDISHRSLSLSRKATTA